MNIFVLDLDPIKAAQYQCDRHVVKMTLETAQILSTVLDGPYRPTHHNHPCVKWAGVSKENADWLITHGLALGEEYTFRYGKVHKSVEVIKSLSPDKLVSLGLTPFAQAMPDQYRNPDVVKAYRDYYRGEKTWAMWTKRRKPEWFQN